MNGINMTMTCGGCPTQYEGDIDGNPFYFRGRWGWWTLTVVKPGMNPVSPGSDENVLYFAEKQFGDGLAGVVDQEDVERAIEQAAARIRKPEEDMNFGSYKSEWSDKLARALAKVSCENPVEPSHGEFHNCGEHPFAKTICAPCSARKYVERFPNDPNEKD